MASYNTYMSRINMMLGVRLRLFVVITLLLELLVSSSGQGLTPQDSTTLGAPPIGRSLRNWWNKAVGVRRRLAARKDLCSNGGGHLCGASAAKEEAEAYWVWTLAASPSGYSALDTTLTGGLAPLSPPQDQGDCNTCVAFAVAAAADLAVAFALRPIVSEVAGISPHDLYHCNPELRLCRSGWSYRPALEMLQQRTKLGSLRTPGCLPYRPDPREQEDQQDLCAPPDRSRCRDAPTALQGRFQFFPLNDVVQVQRHIRNHGGVLTRLQVYPDLKPFFNATPKGIYTRSAAAAKPGSSSSSKGDAIEHAVVVVGYDNDGAFWVMRNSWGDGFAEGGYFRVSYDADVGVLSPGDTYGVRWRPAGGRAAAVPQLEPVAGQPECYRMRATAIDWLADVSYRLNIQRLDALILANTQGPNGSVVRLDVAPAGKPLLVCNIGRAAGSTKEAALAIVGSPSQTFGTTTAALAAQREQNLTQVLDQRSVFLRQGPLTQVCLQTGGWWSPVFVTRHGTAPKQTIGTFNEPLYSTCLDLQPGEVITRLSVLSGFWLDAFLVTTNKQAGIVHLGGGRVQNAPTSAYVDLKPPQEGAFVAGFTFYMGKTHVIGLQVHWGCYQVGGKCVPQ